MILKQFRDAKNQDNLSMHELVKTVKSLNRKSFSSQLIGDLEKTVSVSKKKELIEKFNNIHEEIKSKGLIEEATIEQMVLKPISPFLDSDASTEHEKLDSTGTSDQEESKSNDIRIKKGVGNFTVLFSMMAFLGLVWLKA